MASERITELFVEHFELVWRIVRRLGVSPDGLDDAVQEVFVVLSRRLSEITPGSERAFLYGTAVRVASDVRRARDRRHRATEQERQEQPAHAAHAPRPDELLDQKRARTMLHELIEGLSDDVRPAFVLFELEGLTMAEIATCLALPPGTVASRLRRGREEFEAAVRRLEAARKGLR